MLLLGVDTSSLKPQFDAIVQGRTLLLDADAACYKAVNNCAKLETAIGRFVKAVLEFQFLANCSDVRIHLTSRRSRKANREWYPTVKPYQGNRKNKPKPPLLEPLRNAIAHHASLEDGKIPVEWPVFLHDYWEADDGLVMDSAYYGDRGVVWSEDKDLNISPGPVFDLKTGRTDYIDNRYGWISECYTDSGKLKAKGHGTKFFWWQMLAGDTADNVQGITKLDGKLCGPRGALDLLLPIADENEACNRILWAYAKAGQQFLPEAEVLWLRRHPEDSAYEYIKSLDLDPKLRVWLEDQHQYHQEIFKIKAEEHAEAISEAGAEPDAGHCN